MTKPPPLPTVYPFATKDQRVRAGLIDHFIDSTVWCWFLIIVVWSLFHLSNTIDARSFLLVLAQNFPISIMIIVLYIVLDNLICLSRGQSFGQLINSIYKKNQHTVYQHSLNIIFDTSKIWLHGLISRCLGLPLLTVSVLIWLILNPIVTPMHLHDFSLIEPEGSFLLMIFLLKIIGSALLLFGLFLPFGLGFIREPLPTWYDRLLAVYILEKSPNHAYRHSE